MSSRFTDKDRATRCDRRRPYGPFGACRLGWLPLVRRGRVGEELLEPWSSKRSLLAVQEAIRRMSPRLQHPGLLAHIEWARAPLKYALDPRGQACAARLPHTICARETMCGNSAELSSGRTILIGTIAALRLIDVANRAVRIR